MKTRPVLFEDLGIILVVTVSTILKIRWNIPNPGFCSSVEYEYDPTVTFSERGQFHAFSTFELFIENDFLQEHLFKY